MSNGKALAYQDGASFYSEATGAEIVTYYGMVKNDHDMLGARLARDNFRKEYPQYAFASDGPKFDHDAMRGSDFDRDH